MFKQGDIIVWKVKGTYSGNLFQVVSMDIPYPGAVIKVACTRLDDPRPEGAKEVFYYYADYFELAEGFLNKPAGEQGVSGDMVSHPDHYTAGGIETIDFIKAKLNVMKHLTPFQAYCLGNAMKYIARAGVKDPDKFVEDLQKSVTYLEWAMLGDTNEI